MADREWIEILATHADKLNVGTNEETEYLATFEHQDTLQPLLSLARKVKNALAPVEPDPAFREDLRRSLLATACQRLVSRLGRSAERPRSLRAGQLERANSQAEGSTECQRPAPFFRRYKKEILIGAAALGSIVSVAGIVAYWIYARTARA